MGERDRRRIGNKHNRGYKNTVFTDVSERSCHVRTSVSKFSQPPTSSSCDVPLFPARVFGTRTDMSAPANAFEAPPKVELTKDQAKGTSK